MQKSYRNVLLSLAALGFLVVTPFIVLYALGYRLGGQTGVLFVETFPRGAMVSVDGKFIGDSPEAISNMPAGAAVLEVSREGYRPWKKSIEISPRESAEFRAIRLFLEEPAIHQLVAEIDSFSLSPNRNLLAVLDSRETLHILDADGEEVVVPILLPVAAFQLLWSPDSTLILLQYPDDTLQVFDVATGTLTPLPVGRITAARNVSWDPRIPGRLLVLQEDGTLTAYDHSRQVQRILAEDIVTYAVSNRHIYTINQQSVLSRLTLQGETLNESLVTLEQPVERMFISSRGHIAILFQDRRLSLLPGGSGDPLVVGDHVQTAGFSPDGTMLYVQPDQHELFVFNVDNERLTHIPLKQLHLITRLSQPINHPQWFAGSQHLIFQVADQIVVSEIDTRDHPVTATLDSTNLGNALVNVGQDGEVLFYLKNQGDSSHLVRAQIVAEN